MGPRSLAIVTIIISVLSAPSTHAQQNQLRFDTVDIRVSGPKTIPYMRSRFLRGRYELHNASLLDLISTAWNVDSNPILNRLISCQDVTMAQFAAMLQSLDPDYLSTPVKKSTGINGAPDPIGALSLPDAINKQLGLKLEKRQRPVPILVIDHIEEKPTEN